MMRAKAALICGILLLSLDARAGDPIANRGIDLSGVYHAADIDTVNIYNGNVIIDVPMATQFALNGGFSYGIHLIYTGQPWDFPMEERTSPTWIPETQSKANPVPNRRSNAGMGWRVTMGKLIPPGDPTNLNCQDESFQPCGYWMYESPDGANHAFGNNSLPGTVSDDSSYLRLKTPSGYEEIEFPDGTIQRFNTAGMPTAIYTPFDRAASAGPSVTIDYLTNDPATSTFPCGDTTASTCWKIHDTFGRTQWVMFNTSHNVYGDHQLAQKIMVTAPGGTNVAYTLHYNGQPLPYAETQDTVLHLDTCYTRWGLGEPNQVVSVPLLTSIDLPDGSTYTTTTTNGVGSNGGWCFQGSLTKLTLPTGGSIDYVYTDYVPGYTAKYSPPFVPGVFERRKTPADGSATQPWRYSAGSDDCHLRPDDFHNECYSRTITVTDPDLRTSRYHFSTFSDNDLVTQFSIDHGWSPNEIGLPFTRGITTTNSDGETLYLSSEILDAAGNAERSTYVKYEYDVDSNTGTTPAPFRREKSSLIRYSDGRWSSVTRSLFDHYGHYRQTVTDGTFTTELPSTSNYADHLDQRTEFINYNPTRGTWGTSSFSPVLDGEPWILNTFDSQWVNTPRINPNNLSELAHTKKAEFCFDGTTGFLKRRRLLRNDLRENSTGPSDVLRDGTDLITVFNRNPDTTDISGNVFSEQSYGGDGASLSVADGWCSQTLSSPRYEIRHTYQNGGRATSQYYNGSSPLPFKILDRTIDLSGAVSSERDVSGIQTTYTFDPGDPLRVQSIARTGTATINYTYTNASATPSFTPAQISVTQSDVASRVQYDSFGRIWREFRTMPVGEVTRETLYDASNRKLSESVWAIGSYTNKTTYHYDFLGRLDTVDPPDHQTVTTSYVGDSSRTTTSKVFLATDPSSAQTDVSTTERLDRYGRLWYVQEPNATVTAYGYGVTGALSRVCMKASLSSGVLSTATCGQERLFSYDNRGFMTSETHPENGTTAYTYDAGGHVLTKRPSTVGTQFDLNYTYDEAERLKQVDSSNASSFRVSKEYTYGVANTSSNFALGKSITAVRHNYQTNGDDYRVTETYVYNDLAGRLTDRTTEVFKPDGSQLQKVSQTQFYTTLGQPNILTYPTCQGSVPCGSASQSGVTNVYTNGLLSSVTGFGSLTYHPSGMVNTVSHSNGVTDTYDVDPTGISRPKSITFGTFAACTAPSITSPPASPTITPGNTAMLSVAATPSSVTYQWHDADGTPLPGQTASVFTTPVLNSDHSYFVRVSNSCGMVSASATVHVSQGNAPVITVQPQSTTAVPAHLTVTATGTAPLSYHWYQGLAGDTSTTVGTNSASFDTPSVTVTTKYWVRVSNAAGSADSNVATVTVALGTPTSLTATWNGANQIQVTWGAVSGTNIHYEIWRRDHGSAFAQVTTRTTASFNDTDVLPTATYVYKVRALDVNNESASSFSNVDLATTMNFTPLGDGRILRDDVTELLTALNAMQVAAGWPQLTWSGILQGSPPPPPPALNVVVYAEHILALRRNMDLVYSQLLGTTPPAYTEPTLTNPNLPGSPKVTIKWLHITELRSRVQ